MDYSSFFKNLRPLSAPVGLVRSIIERIRFEERREARRAVLIATPVLLASTGGVFFGFDLALRALAQSSLPQYLSLLTDPASVASVWQSFSLTILETVPVFALTVLVGALLLFASSATVTAVNARRAFLTA